MLALRLLALGMLLALMWLAATTTIGSGGNTAVTWYWPWGQCTWYAASRRPDIAARMAGDAWNWVNAAEEAGIPTGPEPEPRALVVYQPGIHGANWRAGHVGYVEAVASDGTFQLSESNVFGLGVVDRRLDRPDRGVRFIY